MKGYFLKNKIWDHGCMLKKGFFDSLAIDPINPLVYIQAIFNPTP